MGEREGEREKTLCALKYFFPKSENCLWKSRVFDLAETGPLENKIKFLRIEIKMNKKSKNETKIYFI